MFKYSDYVCISFYYRYIVLQEYFTVINPPPDRNSRVHPHVGRFLTSHKTFPIRLFHPLTFSLELAAPWPLLVPNGGDCGDGVAGGQEEWEEHLEEKKEDGGEGGGRERREQKIFSLLLLLWHWIFSLE